MVKETHPEHAAETVVESQVSAVAGILRDWTRLYGRDAVIEFVRGLQKTLDEGRTPELGALEEVFAERASREEFQEAALEWFEKDGFIEHAPDGTVILDAQKLFRGFSLSVYGARRHLRPAPGVETFGQIRLEYLGNAFAGVSAVLKEDWERGERKPKPVFYLPESRDEAFDPARIRESDFHFGLWEIPLATNARAIKPETIQQPAAFDDLSFFEASIAAAVYHPRYGDGRRDKTGKLMVRYPDGQYRSITGDWMHEMLPDPMDEKGSSCWWDRVRESLRKIAPGLIHRGLLVENDFRVRRRLVGLDEKSQMTASGLARVENVRYYIGREYAKAPVRLDRITSEIGAVVGLDEDGTGQLVAIFNLYKHGDSRLTKRRTATGTFYDAPNELTHAISFDRTAFQKRRSGESDEAYRARLEALENFELLLRFDNDLKQKTETRLRELPPDLFAWVRAHPDAVRRELPAFESFIEETGLDGLETIAQTIDKPEVLSLFFEIRKRLSKKEQPRFLEAFRGPARERYQVLHLLHGLVEQGQLGQDVLESVESETGHHLFETMRTAADLVRRGVKEASRLSEQLKAERVRALEDLPLSFRLDVVATLSKAMGAEAVRDALSRIYARADTADQKLTDGLLRLLNPEAPEEIHKDLRELYKALRFEEYKMNERMQKTDEGRLAEIPAGTQALDLGAGAGRLMKPLRKRGVAVAGVDFVDRHVRLLKKEMPDAEVALADWVKTPFNAGRFETVYCLGRSLTHEFRADRQRALFEEANRLLKPGGRFIFDIPDRAKGHYAKLISNYDRIMERRNLVFREGTIYDSPDGENFFTRYVFSEEDIRELAAEADFEIERVERQPLATGEGDENIYFTLRKVKAVPMAAAAK